MAKYILKQEAIFALTNEANIHKNPVKRAYTRAAAIIEQITAEDVQPGKHGKWIDHKKFERKNCNVCIECSVCNTWFGHDCIPKTKFCPNCGARMDGDSE